MGRTLAQPTAGRSGGRREDLLTGIYFAGVCTTITGQEALRATSSATLPNKVRIGGTPSSRRSIKTAEIAEQLHLSVKTIETYRDRMRQKLDLSDGTALAHYATKWVLENG